MVRAFSLALKAPAECESAEGEQLTANQSEFRKQKMS